MGDEHLPSDHEGRPIDFGRTVVDYERHRPGFPDSFFDRLVDRGWVRPGQRVLDVGTGTGSLALGFAQRDMEVCGLDPAAALLDAARAAAAARGIRAQFIEGRAESTGLTDESFDIVTAGQCWWWLDSTAAAGELLRVLRPGGRLIICDFSYVPLPGSVAGRTEGIILTHNPGWAMSGWTGIHPEQVAALDAAGFREVESFSYVVDVPFTHAGWRGRMRTCSAVGAALDASVVERFDMDLARLLEDEFPGPLSIPHRVFAVSGTKAGP